MEKSADAFRTISEVADDLTLPQHVLRFWETRFPQIRPLKRAGGRRYYRPADVVLLKTIRQLLYDDGYTIKGVQRLLKEQGPKALAAPLSIEPADAAGDEESLEENEYLPDDTNQDIPIDPSLPGASHSYRDTLIEAISSIEECLHILAAARDKL